jgi:hypothetical protein
MNKFLLGYVSGVVSGMVATPAVCYIFRMPLYEHVVQPVLVNIVFEEEFDDKIFGFMSDRLEFQELRQKLGKQAHELRAQGLSAKEIAQALNETESRVRLLLMAKKPGETPN